MLRNPTTFSFEDISNWKTDITKLPSQIEESAAKLVTLASEHTRLTAQKEELTQNSINPQQERVNAIQWKLTILEHPEKFSAVISQVNSYISELAEQRGTAQELQTRLGILRQKIASYEAAETLTKCQMEDLTLRSKLARLTNEITEHTERQLALSTALHTLKERMKAATSELERLNTAPAGGGYSSTQTPGGGYTSNQHSNHRHIHVIRADIDALHNQIRSNEAESCRNADCIQSLRRDLEATNNRLAQNLDLESILSNHLSKINLKIPASLSSIENMLAYDRKSLSGLELNEKKLNREMQNNELQKKTLENRLIHLESDYDASRTHLNAYHGELKNTLTDDTYTLNNLHDLTTFFNKENGILNGYKSNRDQLISSIQTNLSRQQDENRTKARNESKLQSRHADKFMSDFNGEDVHKIKIILDNLSQKLMTALDKYNKEHPRINDAHIRGRLREYSSRVEFILSNNRQPNGNPQDLRERVINLSGYIWTLTDNINDKTFKQVVLDVLDKGAISQADSTKQFAILKDNNQAQLFRITPEHLKASEAEDYRLAYENLKKTLEQQPKNSEYYVRYLFSTGKNLLDIVNDNNSSFDHSAKILNAARELILDFKLPANHQHLADLLKENQHGKRSTPKVVIGAIMMVLGAAGFAVCLTLGVLSLGILSAPAMIGMASSATVFGLGAALCINGRNKGVHKAMMNFQWAAEKSDYKYATSPLSNHSYFQKPTAPPMDASAPMLTN